MAAILQMTFSSAFPKLNENFEVLNKISLKYGL